MTFPQGWLAVLCTMVGLLGGGLLGLWIGWLRGRRLGRQQGQAEAPLVLREKALMTGKCPFCYDEVGEKVFSAGLQE